MRSTKTKQPKTTNRLVLFLAAILSIIVISGTFYAFLLKPVEPPYKSKTTVKIIDTNSQVIPNAQILLFENDSLIHESRSIIEGEMKGYTFLPYPIKDNWCMQIIQENYDTFKVCDFAHKLNGGSIRSLTAELKPIGTAKKIITETVADEIIYADSARLVRNKEIRLDEKLKTRTLKVSEPFVGLFSNKSEAAGRALGDAATMEMDVSYKDFSSISEAPAKSYAAPGRKAGTLTAGEVNDFNKFKMWEDLAENQFELYKNEWLMNFSNRYAVVLKNGEDGAVIQAKVSLVDDEDNAIWSTMTNNAGRCELWVNPFNANEIKGKLKIKIEYAGHIFDAENPVNYNVGVNQVKLPVGCHLSNTLDVAFVVDATGSMGDEIEYLKTELLDVIEGSKKQNPELEINTSSVFYRDVTDDYLVRTSDFSSEVSNTLNFIKEQGAGGGGDFPEAVDTALNTAINHLNWSAESRNRILFLLLDAPPHSDEKAKRNMQRAFKMAAKKGIRIVPVVCSGHSKSNEYLMRSGALATNGTYIFLTDHSGVGGSHITPTTDEFEVTYLNQLMKEVIIRYSDATSCANDVLSHKNLQSTIIDYVLANESLKAKYGKALLPKNIELSLEVSKTSGDVLPGTELPEVDSLESLRVDVYPNPTQGVVSVSFNKSIERLVLLDGAGQMLREFTTFGNQVKINLSEYADGIYFVGLINETGKMKMARLVLQK
ncbi:MAG: T9SS type A sorting domain-containing protein [Bacteroidia bacterium]